MLHFLHQVLGRVWGPQGPMGVAVFSELPGRAPPEPAWKPSPMHLRSLRLRPPRQPPQAHPSLEGPPLTSQPTSRPKTGTGPGWKHAIPPSPGSWSQSPCTRGGGEGGGFEWFLGARFQQVKRGPFLSPGQGFSLPLRLPRRPGEQPLAASCVKIADYDPVDRGSGWTAGPRLLPCGSRNRGALAAWGAPEGAHRDPRHLASSAGPSMRGKQGVGVASSAGSQSVPFPSRPSVPQGESRCLGSGGEGSRKKFLSKHMSCCAHLGVQGQKQVGGRGPPSGPASSLRDARPHGPRTSSGTRGSTRSAPSHVVSGAQKHGGAHEDRVARGGGLSARAPRKPWEGKGLRDTARGRERAPDVQSEAFSPLVLPARLREGNGLASQPRRIPREPATRTACRVSSFLDVLRCFTRAKSRLSLFPEVRKQTHLPS